MKYPCLILPQFCQTPVTVTVNSPELDEDGETPELCRVETKCNLQTKAHKTLTPDKSLVTLSGNALFPGDLCPGAEEISSGTLISGPGEYSIYRGSKARNPDGTVNFTELELM